jgi:hypothetical protein
VLGALLTAESLLGVDPALVSSQMTGCVKCHLTIFASVVINEQTWERLLVQMNRCNVLLKGGMLSEGLFTGRVLSTAVLVPPVVRSDMTAEP